MSLEWMDFLTILVFTFAIVMLVAGLFTAYFGSGKSRKVGVALLVIGLLVGVVWAYLVGWSDIELFSDVPAWDVMRSALINIVAAVIGALAAVGIFLVAVMKS
jgi:biotin transporter BioY